MLVELSRVIGLFAFCQIEVDLTDRLGIEVDLVDRRGLFQRIGENILREVVYIE